MVPSSECCLPFCTQTHKHTNITHMHMHTRSDRHMPSSSSSRSPPSLSHYLGRRFTGTRTGWETGSVLNMLVAGCGGQICSLPCLVTLDTVAFLTTEGGLSDTVTECIFLYLRALLPGLWKVTPLAERSRGRREVGRAPKKEQGKAGGIPRMKRETSNADCDTGRRQPFN